MKSVSYTDTHIHLFKILFPYRPLQIIEWSSLCYTVSRSLLIIYFIHSSVYIGEGNGKPLQRSCLENLRDGGAWWAAVYGVAQSDTTEAT